MCILIDDYAAAKTIFATTAKAQSNLTHGDRGKDTDISDRAGSASAQGQASRIALSFRGLRFTHLFTVLLNFYRTHLFQKCKACFFGVFFVILSRRRSAELLLILFSSIIE